MPVSPSSVPARSARGSLFRVLVLLAAGAAAFVLTAMAVSVVRGTAPVEGPVADGTWTARTRAWFTARGVYPAEFDPKAATHFAWTHTSGTFVVPVIDRRRAHVLGLRVRGLGPQPGQPPQELTLSVDGIVAERLTLTGASQDVRVTLAPSSGTRAVAGFQLSRGMVPGPQDPRELGMIVESISIAATDGSLRVPGRVLALGALAGVLAAAALLLAGTPWPWSAVLAAILAGGQAALTSLDAAFLGDSFIWRVLAIDTAIAGAAGLYFVLRSWRPAVNAAALRAGIGVVLVVFGLRTAVFLHPAITIGDAIFQVHRADLVHRGTYFFTSITPRPFFEFPYAPGLYVAAMPFWTSAADKGDKVLLLRAIVLAVDAAAAIALLIAVRRFWGSPGALAAAAVYQLVPIGLHTICTSNLTNAFGQSTFTIALLTACVLAGRLPALAWSALFALHLSIGFLSHFSTLSLGVPMAAAAAIAASLRRVDRRTGAFMALALCAALALSYGLYYSHFHEVYRQTIHRVMSGEGHAESRSMVAPVSVKLQRFAGSVRHEYFGLPLVIAGLTAVIIAARRRLHDLWTRVLLAWLLVGVGFFALGILTPIEMRAALSLQPVMAALCGLTVATLWSGALPGRAAAVGVVALVVWRGVSDWLLCLGLVARP